ncbi:MAG: hypothetical protein WA144_11525 [Candidatus Methanoperedens sp.]
MVDKKIKLIQEQQNIKPVRSDEFREIIQDRIIGGIKEGYFVYVIQSERFDSTIGLSNVDNRGVELVDEIQVKLTPQQAYRTYEWLGKLLKKYEEIFGEIKLIEKVAEDKPELMEKS